ncbi:hypothetical protein J8I87_00600 [Paraburkholderia sp. LEh10]|uniref:hypothetical protein n=1 Tax=Paraburkholderia sp. LEh10 TaxID=2821353 RepID=UPI001AE20D93|nr:hypothetical protein [Paraburkholderia sp. LEh10]MBP0588245.1 hypothetical protein [Paraburkholderia sp. LEh10]
MNLGDPAARASVDKLFTFATPHNGIDMLDVNVPKWLTKGEINTFNRDEMAGFLDMRDITEKFGRVDLMPDEVLGIDRIFCMVGTNRCDYETAEGMARAFVGHGSDGLVKIANASLCGLKNGAITEPAATAFAYRSHSGYFGIVNSEEAYQNLVRFLFGDVRVDIWMDIDSATLPRDLDGVDKVEALYQIELKAAPRGKRWFLTRRTAIEDSPACRTHSEIVSGAPERKQIYLSSVFLSKRAIVDKKNNSLAYAMVVGVKVPDYEIDHRFWPNGHYEGADLFRDTAFLEVTPADSPNGDWKVAHWWASRPSAVTTDMLNFANASDGKIQLKLAFANPNRPGIAGTLRLVIRPWE